MVHFCNTSQVYIIHVSAKLRMFMIPTLGGRDGNSKQFSTFCLVFYVDKLLYSYYVVFANFTTSVFSVPARLGSHVT